MRPRCALFLVSSSLVCSFGTALHGQTPTHPLRNRDGLEISVDQTDLDPALHVILPGDHGGDRSFKILMPEHVTVRQRGHAEAEHLYVYQPGEAGHRPAWRETRDTLAYSQDLNGITFSAQVTLQPDGLLFHYTFANHTKEAFDMAWAVTDPRFHTIFFDPRLERTYVHHPDGFDLLAAETPARLTVPLSQWLPARYHAQLTAPIPADRAQHRADGITYYYKSRPVDLPLIATLSTDHQWVAASLSHEAGNVWSNPELTCQHVDPQVSLPAGGTAVYEVKLFLFRGGLKEVLAKARAQQPRLQQTPGPP